jgi:exopolysaccharide production protein ExoQ
MFSNSRIRKWTQVLLFLNVFMVEAIFRQRSFADKSIDLQIVLKMGLWVLTFVFCVALFRLWGKRLLRVDNIFQVFLLADIVISCFYAPVFTYSFASAFSLIAVMFMLMLASAVLTNAQIIHQIILGCTLVAAISIIVYFADPSLGRMHEWNVQGTRLAGITGTANAIGYISAMCLLALYYYRDYLPKVTWTYWAFIVINLAALIMSNSRTSMIAMILSICAAAMMKPSPARMMIFFFTICAGILFMALVDYDSLFSMLARSGDANEITSGTGRTAIWSTALNLIAEKPWFGWGYAATNTILPEQKSVVGFVASHTHNAVLQILFSVGVVGLFFFIMLMATKIYYSIKSGEQLNMAFIVFLLIDGLTEPIAFQGPATTTTIVLATVLALNFKERTANEAVDPTYQQRLPGSDPA